MEISGKVVALMAEQTGPGKNGNWRKREFVLETQGQYPKKVCISVWGDKIDQFNLKEGDTITVSFELESREYNGRWYTDVKAWKAVKGEAGPATESPQPSSFSSPLVVPESEIDDLPF